MCPISSSLSFCLLILVLVALNAGCGGGSGNAQTSTPNPQPTITSISPSATLVGAGSQTLTINGSNFLATSTVTFAGTPHSATFVNSQQLTIVITQSDATSVGSFPVVVTNPPPGGGQSSASNFRVQGGTLQVQITGLPSGAAASVSITSTTGYSAVVTSNQTLQLPPGTFAVSASFVGAGNFNYYPSPSQQSLTIADGSANSVQVAYSTVIPKTTKVLDQNGMQSLTVSPDGSTLTFSNSSPVATSLSPADILVVAPTSASPNGLLRQINSVTQSGSSIVAVTSQATLAAAIQQGNLQISQILTSQNIRSVSSKVAGFRVALKSPPDTVKGQAASSIADPCAGSPVTITETGSLDLFAGLQETGTLEICANFQVNAQFSWAAFQLQTAKVTATVAGQTKLSIEGEYKAGLFNGTQNLAQVEFAPIVGSVGPFPVVLVPEMTFSIGANGNVVGSLSTAIAANLSATGGFQYANGQVSPINQVSLSFGYDPLSLDASLSAKVFMQDEIDLLFYGIAGPYFRPDAYLQFSSDINQNPWWTLTGGLEGPVGLKADILGFSNLGDFELGKVFDLSKILAQAPGPFLLGVVTPGLSSLSPIQAAAGSGNLTLSLAGTNFVPGVVASFNGSPLATTFVGTQILTAVVPASDFSNAGTFPVTVADPNVVGAVSNSLPFAVVGTGLNPVPAITSISPSSAPVNSSSISLAVSGNGFINSSIASFGGLTLSTTFVSSTQLSATIPSSALTVQSTVPVTVANPSPGGGTSNPVNFTVAPSAGTVSITLSPSVASVPVGGVQTIAATVSGTSNTAVTWSIAEGGLGGSISYGIHFYDGIYIPPSSSGTFHIVATSQADASVHTTALVTVTPALTFTVLHAFSGADGSQPLAKLIQGTDGSFYGTTQSGGANGLGTIFKIDSTGNQTVLHSFNGSDGFGPIVGLTQGSDGNFYGIAIGGPGGYGTAFRIDSLGNFAILHSFSATEGSGQYSSLIQGADGFLYGMSQTGGQNGGGTAFRLDTAGNVTVLHSFPSCSDVGNPGGCQPRAGLAQASDGNFYGTTYWGGINGQGTIFKMDSGGQITILHAFNFSDGSSPLAPVIQAKDGFLYGTASSGGPGSNGGEVFKIDLNGTFSVLHAFDSPDGFEPETGLLEDADGYFYGITPTGGVSSSSLSLGVIYRIDAQGNVTVLHSFDAAQPGSYYPRGGIVRGSDGNFYGVAQAGGANQAGIVFKLAHP